MVTCVPTGPLPGLMPVIVGAGVSVKLTALLVPPAVVTCTVAVPVLVDVGTVKQTWLSVQGNGEATALPFNARVLLPCDAPNPDPFTHCLPPTGMLLRFTLVIEGGPITVKLPVAKVESMFTHTVCCPGLFCGTVTTIC